MSGVFGDEGWRPARVHPLAARFPELPPADFEALVEDIRANGLVYPIVCDGDELIDGRMRLKACDAAGREPEFVQLSEAVPPPLNGDASMNAVAFIWSVNAKRRQMTGGQKAMIAASDLVLAAKTDSDNEKTKEAVARAAGVPCSRISQALTVAIYAEHLVQDVIDSVPGRTLDAVYKIAVENKRQQERSRDGLNTLRKQDPELAQKVDDREISVEEAFAEIDKRKRERAAQRDSVLLGISSGVGSLVGFDESEALPEVIIDLRTEEGQEHLARYFKGGVKELGEKLVAAKRGLAALERAHKQINGR